MKRQYILIVLIIFFVACAFYYFSIPTIDTTHPIRNKIVQAVYAPGNIEPTIMLPISPKTTGIVTAFYADEGDRVTKGQSLAEVDASPLRSSLSSQKSKLDFYKAELDRKKYLYGKNVIGKEMLDGAVRDYESALFDFNTIKHNIQDTQITAQEDGLIIKRDIEVGQLIDPSKQVFWYSANDTLRVTAFVDEEEVNEIKVGQKVYMHADAFKGEVFYGTIVSITPKGDPIERNFRVRIALNDPGELKIGMSVECNILIKQKDDALYIPKTAVKDGKVMIIDYMKRLQTTNVTTGIEDSQYIEIIDGIKDTDKIATTYPKLTAGTRVRS